MTYLQRRQALDLDHIVGGASSPQEIHRRELIDKVGQEASRPSWRATTASKKPANWRPMSKSPWPRPPCSRSAQWGWGRWSPPRLLSSALDITGMLAAGTLAIVGFFVIPYKRKQAKEDFREKIIALRDEPARGADHARLRAKRPVPSARLRENIDALHPLRAR